MSRRRAGRIHWSDRRIVVVHGDDRGLVLPPKVAPIEAVILPIAAHKPGVLDKANEIAEQLK